MEKDINNILERLEEELTDEILLELYEDAVILEETGICYSKKSIEKCLENKKQCPKTKIMLTTCKMIKVKKVDEIISLMKQLYPQIERIKQSELEKEQRIIEFIKNNQSFKDEVMTNTGDILEENLEIIKKASEDVINAELKIENLKNQLISKEKELLNIEEEKKFLRKNNESNINYLNKIIKNLKQTIEEKDETIKNLTSDIDGNLSNEIENMKTVLSKKNEEIEELKSLLSSLNDNLKSKTNEINSLNTDIDNLKTNHKIERDEYLLKSNNELRIIEEKKNNKIRMLNEYIVKSKLELEDLKEIKSITEQKDALVLSNLKKEMEKLEERLMENRSIRESKFKMAESFLEDLISINSDCIDLDNTNIKNRGFLEDCD